MLKRTINEFKITLRLESASPLLVKDGRYEAIREAARTDDKLVGNLSPNAIPISRCSDEEMSAAIRASLSPGKPTDMAAKVAKFAFYIPGSSLRGAWRSWLERALRYHERPGLPQVCDPFNQDARIDQSCSKALEHSVAPYANSCPVCRMFGSTVQASRFDIGDAELVAGCTPRVAIRDQVAISRATGGVQNKFQMFALEDAQFNVTLRLRNFELAQLRMLGLIVAEISRIPIGSGKGKGLGWMRPVYLSSQLTYIGQRPADRRVRGMGEDPRWGAEIRQKYGIVEMHNPPELPEAAGEPWAEESPWRFVRALAENEFNDLWLALDLGWQHVPELAARQ